MGSETSNKALPSSVGNYDLIAKVAEGGMGTVYKGRNRDTGQIVAIKIVPPNMARNPVLIERFRQEFRAASLLDHPNIVRALDYGAGTSPFLVMEFVEGESIGQRIERDGRMPEPEALKLIVQVCQGLHKAHKQGMIHRDVKPDNVMITPDGQAKLTDLGLVKDQEAELNLTRTGRGLGTPHFMAPEQFRNAKNADVRCDIYSLGATLYMMVTGQNPFSSCGPLDAWMKKVHNDFIPPRKLAPELSERTDMAIRRSMSADPDSRPASCREFVEDLTGQTTRRLVTQSEQAAGAPRDLWYLVYKDDQGVTHTVKGSTEGIRRSLREGLLGDARNIRACRTKSGPFDPLRDHGQFRDLVPESTVKPGSSDAQAPVTAGSGQTAALAATVKLPALGTTSNPTPNDVPQIDLSPHHVRPFEWVKWGIIILVAVASAMLAMLFLFAGH